jgi:L-ascorbate metabolism protein UlaG (beta-lactamase superfamily)
MAVRIGYVGHGTVLIDLDGARLLTDPLLRRRVAHLRRAAPPPPADVMRGIDAVLVSHAHYDHLDLPSLERLGKSLPVVVPRGLGRLLRGRNYEHVTEIDVGEDLRIGALSVRATPADHAGSRGPFGARATAVGFAVRGSASVYFAGDTGLFPEMEGLVDPLDLALLPIWGWGPSLGPGHLDPAGAAEAARMLAPRTVIPIHWGTYAPLTHGLWRSPAFLRSPPSLFAAELAKAAPDVALRVLQPGEEVTLSQGDG